jgi:hypothetical protein
MSTVTIDGIIYTNNTTTAIVTSYVSSTVNVELIIQSNVTIGGFTLPVTKINDMAFMNFNKLTGITIPDSITSIETSAFNNCSALTSITIPNSVTNIGHSLFKGCIRLTSITMSNNITSIATNTFQSCSALPSITIPNSVTSIEYYAFSSCNALTSITIPNSVTSIGNSAFNNCSALTSITIPNSVTSIGISAFNRCTALTSITIPNSVISIEISAFSNCRALTSITIPNSVTSINHSTFSNCSALTSITIPNSVTSIGTSAFNGCSALTSITIPNSVTSIGPNAFNNCNLLIDVTINNIYVTPSFNSFTNISTNINSKITFSNVYNINELSSIWQTICTYYFKKCFKPTIEPWVIPTKTYGNTPFSLMVPVSNSDGSFTYESSDPSIATVNIHYTGFITEPNNIVISMNAVGTVAINAIQTETSNYTSGFTSATLIVIESTNINPTIISTSDDLNYFMNTSAKYGNIMNSFSINFELVSLYEKELFTTNPSGVIISLP